LSAFERRSSELNIKHLMKTIIELLTIFLPTMSNFQTKSWIDSQISIISRICSSQKEINRRINGSTQEPNENRSLMLPIAMESWLLTVNRLEDIKQSRKLSDYTLLPHYGNIYFIYIISKGFVLIDQHGPNHFKVDSFFYYPFNKSIYNQLTVQQYEGNLYEIALSFSEEKPNCTILDCLAFH